MARPASIPAKFWPTNWRSSPFLRPNWRGTSRSGNRITQIVQGKRAVTGDTAMRLGHPVRDERASPGSIADRARHPRRNAADRSGDQAIADTAGVRTPDAKGELDPAGRREAEGTAHAAQVGLRYAPHASLLARRQTPGPPNSVCLSHTLRLSRSIRRVYGGRTRFRRAKLQREPSDPSDTFTRDSRSGRCHPAGAAGCPSAFEGPTPWSHLSSRIEDRRDRPAKRIGRLSIRRPGFVTIGNSDWHAP